MFNRKYIFLAILFSLFVIAVIVITLAILKVASAKYYVPSLIIIFLMALFDIVMLVKSDKKSPTMLTVSSVEWENSE